MKRFSVLLGLVCISFIVPKYAGAIDVWDATGGHVDDNNGTDNELASGSEQLHDLQAVGGTADQDWYRIGQLPYSSYEVIVDGLTEEVASIPATTSGQAIQVDLVDGAGTLISSGYAFSQIGAARSLRFRNQTATEEDNQYVRVTSGSSGGCTTTCTTNAQYRILFRETTLMAPRFNNSGTQTTVLILQNGSNSSVAGTARFFNATGTLLGSSTFSLNAHGTLVLPTNTVTGVSGQSGSITIDHSGRYGQLTGKAVALEPSTGFAFDTIVGPKIN